jgi:hypothetical protein
MTQVVEHIVNTREHVRHRCKTKVQVVVKGLAPKMCQAVNLSANGVGIKTDGMGLRKGMKATLSFAIVLGAVVKIHRRIATVTHVTKGITGFTMEAYTQGGLI